ncbi:MAG: hypothetical protein ACK58T_27600, partial [Phycisphaerae bacterium]
MHGIVFTVLDFLLLRARRVLCGDVPLPCLRPGDRPAARGEDAPARCFRPRHASAWLINSPMQRPGTDENNVQMSDIL